MSNNFDNWVNKKDAEYCRKCIFRSETWPNNRYLCDYALKTGQRRGCPAGVGCTRRVMEKKKS